MTAGIEVYTEDGRLSISTELVPLKVIRMITAGAQNSTWTATRFPLSSPSGTQTIRRSYIPYPSVDARENLIFVKAETVGNGVSMSGDYYSTNYRTYFGIYANGNTNYNINLAVVQVNQTTTTAKFIAAYNESGVLTWSLDNLIKAVKVIATVPITGPLTTYQLPDWVDASKVYINVNDSYCFDNDNGTDPYYDICGCAFQIIGRTVYFRIYYVTQSTANVTIPHASTLLVAMITDGDSTVAINSAIYTSQS